jgi:hypothetical protein
MLPAGLDLSKAALTGACTGGDLALCKAEILPPDLHRAFPIQQPSASSTVSDGCAITRCSSSTATRSPAASRSTSKDAAQRQSNGGTDASLPTTAAERQRFGT